MELANYMLKTKIFFSGDTKTADDDYYTLIHQGNAPQKTKNTACVIV